MRDFKRLNDKKLIRHPRVETSRTEERAVLPLHILQN